MSIIIILIYQKLGSVKPVQQKTMLPLPRENYRNGNNRYFKEFMLTIKNSNEMTDEVGQGDP